MLDRHPLSSSSIMQATADQMAELLAFAALSPDAPHWPAAAWQSFLKHSRGDSEVLRCLFVLRLGIHIAGAIAVAMLGDVTELELLLVRPSSRRQGIGRALSEYWMHWAVEARAREAVLEVRASNVAAQELYRRLGFVKQGLRPHYYSDPREDAFLLHCALAPNPVRSAATVSNSGDSTTR